MKKICFMILVLFSSMMMGCAALSTSKNASEDESEVFDVTENAKVEEKSEQEELSTDVENQLSQEEETAEMSIEESTEAASSEEVIAELVFEKEWKETDNPRIAELLNVSGIHFDGFNQDHYHYQMQY